MKKALIAISVILGAFAVGLAGMYVAMPQVAPDVVEEARPENPSETASSSPSAKMAATALPADASPADTDTTDSPDSLSLPSPRVDSTVLRSLKDTVAALRDSLDNSKTHAASLSKQINDYKEQVAKLKEHRAKAAQLSGTLAKLEIRELRDVLQQLNMPVIEELYAQASGRNQKRLLQAMPAERAAHFVNNMMSSSARSSSP